MARSTNGLGIRKSSGKDPVVNSGQRKTIGTSIYAMKPDAPSATEFRTGMLETKEGFGKSDGPDNMREAGGKGRKSVMRSSMGARYGISEVGRPAQGFEMQNVQSNGRIVPAVMGTRSNFGAGTAYGQIVPR